MTTYPIYSFPPQPLVYTLTRPACLAHSNHYRFDSRTQRLCVIHKLFSHLFDERKLASLFVYSILYIAN